MKHYAILIICITGFAAAIPVKADLEILNESNTLAANNKACIERAEVTSEHVEELRINPTAEMPKSSMCYIKCMAELSGVEKDGLMQKDALVNYRPDGVTKENAEKLFEECSKLDAVDPCEKTFLRYLCVFEKSERKIWLKTE